MTDATHDRELRAIIDVPADHPFPIQNLPFGVMRPSAGALPRPATALGDHVVDLKVLADAGCFADDDLLRGEVFSASSLNGFMALGRDAWRQARHTLSRLLSGADNRLKDDEALRDRAILPARRVEMLLPARVGDYTDFYASRYHATNVGTMFRGPDNALQPNWVWLPVGYHGRASSLVVSGTDIQRPSGQQAPTEDGGTPGFGKAKLMDYELEMGAFVGPGNRLGEPIPIERATDHVFGLALVNDWSARDIQKWEYVPLGPFLGKSFATTVSPWIITLEALAPFRTEGPEMDPEPLEYLREPGQRAYDIHLEVWLENDALSERVPLTTTNFKHMYWSVAQQLTHHAVNGCNMQPGDLLASGTISGPTKESRGCLLERTWKGTEPIQLPDGSEMKFLRDGDEVVMTGWAQGDGYRIGFGECRGKLVP